MLGIDREAGARRGYSSVNKTYHTSQGFGITFRTLRRGRFGPPRLNLRAMRARRWESIARGLPHARIAPSSSGPNQKLLSENRWPRLRGIMDGARGAGQGPGSEGQRAGAVGRTGWLYRLTRANSPPIRECGPARRRMLRPAGGWWRWTGHPSVGRCYPVAQDAGRAVQRLLPRLAAAFRRRIDGVPSPDRRGGGRRCILPAGVCAGAPGFWRRRVGAAEKRAARHLARRHGPVNVLGPMRRDPASTAVCRGAGRRSRRACSGGRSDLHAQASPLGGRPRHVSS